MRAVVLLCLLEAASVQAWYYWDDASVEPTDDGTACRSDHRSCGCCLMKEWMKEAERLFNYKYEEMKGEMAIAKTVLDSMTGDRSVFSVTLNNARALECSGPYGQDRVVVYRHAFINLNGHYDEQSGIFTVPYSGVYSLSVTIYASTSPGHTLAACASLLVNGNAVSELHDNNGQDIEDSATVVVAVKLSAGDRVAVSLPEGCVICDDDNHHSTFTGYLLYTI